MRTANCSCGTDLNGDGVRDPYRVSPLEDDGTVSRITIDIGGSDKSVTGSFELGDGGAVCRLSTNRIFVVTGFLQS